MSTTPADVHGARVVVLCSRSRVWTSPHLPTSEAAELLDEVCDTVAAFGDSSGLLVFECGDGRTAWIRARALESIELRPATVAPVSCAGPS